MNYLITVENMEKSKEFYNTVFGLYTVRDFGDNVILTQGLVLQQAAAWRSVIGKDIVPGNNTLLYFEDNNFDAFLEKIESFDIQYVTDVDFYCENKRLIRIKDPDEHIIEVREI